MTLLRVKHIRPFQGRVEITAQFRGRCPRLLTLSPAGTIRHSAIPNERIGNVITSAGFICFSDHLVNSLWTLNLGWGQRWDHGHDLKRIAQSRKRLVGIFRGAFGDDAAITD